MSPSVTTSTVVLSGVRRSSGSSRLLRLTPAPVAVPDVIAAPLGRRNVPRPGLSAPWPSPSRNREAGKRAQTQATVGADGEPAGRARRSDGGAVVLALLGGGRLPRQDRAGLQPCPQLGRRQRRADREAL